MRIERRDNTRENLILAAMISSTDVLSRIVPLWDKVKLKAESSSIIGQLCVNYFSSYGKAPRKHIEDSALVWAEDETNEPLVSLVNAHLGHLSDSYRQKKRSTNVQMVMEIFEKHVLEITLRKAALDTLSCLDAGRIEDAKSALGDIVGSNWRGASEESGTFLLEDDVAWQSIFETESSEIMIRYSGGLAKFWSTALQRDTLVTFVSPEGTGKSWFLMDMAYRAIQQRRRVAFFETGDMSKRQILRRLAVRMAQRPLRPGIVKYPKSLSTDGDVDFDQREFGSDLDMEVLLASRDKLIKNYIKSRDPYLYLSIHAAGEISVAGIVAKLKRLEDQYGWLPDCVFIDYADILAPPKGRFSESRDKIAETWIQLRALSVQHHCLLVTATQSNREGYDAKGGLRMKHTSEEKRKNSHAAYIVGINVTDFERENGLIRLNLTKARDMEFNPKRFCCCASCLPLGNPCVLSVFPLSYENDNGQGKVRQSKRNPVDE